MISVSRLILSLLVVVLACLCAVSSGRDVSAASGSLMRRRLHQGKSGNDRTANGPPGQNKSKCPVQVATRNMSKTKCFSRAQIDGCRAYAKLDAEANLRKDTASVNTETGSQAAGGTIGTAESSGSASTEDAIASTSGVTRAECEELSNYDQLKQEALNQLTNGTMSEAPGTPMVMGGNMTAPPAPSPSG